MQVQRLVRTWYYYARSYILLHLEWDAASILFSFKATVAEWSKVASIIHNEAVYVLLSASIPTLVYAHRL